MPGRYAVLAEQLGAAFLDIDHEIERRQRMSVSEIFASLGEDAFRGMERAMTQDLATRPSMVIAPGGGWMVDPENVALLRASVPDAIALARVWWKSTSTR